MMRAALGVHLVTADRLETLHRVVGLVHEAADQRADLVLFSETAITGFKATDQPQHDLGLGETIPGTSTDAIAGVAKERNIWVTLGLFEREGAVLFDSAVLISPAGHIVLKHRRSDGRWHFRNADPKVYGSGSDINAASTPWGSVVLLLCGELMSEEHIEVVRQLAPTYLLVPFARGYDEDAPDDNSWYEQNLPFYAAQATKAGTITLMTNYLEPSSSCCFGGAHAISGEGEVIASKPLHQEGLLLVDV